MCTEEDIKAFDALLYKNKAIFVHKPMPEYKSAVYLPGTELDGTDGQWVCPLTSYKGAEISDEDAEPAREELVNVKGYFILPSQLFVNVRARADKDENLNETLEKVFWSIEGSAQGTASEDDFKGLFDDIDVNSNKLGGTVAKRNEKLVKLLNGVGDMKLGD